MKQNPVPFLRAAGLVEGISFLVLLFVAMPLKYFADRPALTEIVSPIHGLLYIGYIVVTVLLARTWHWSPPRTVGVMLAGTIPFLSFWVERRVVAWVRHEEQLSTWSTAAAHQ